MSILPLPPPSVLASQIPVSERMARLYRQGLLIRAVVGGYVGAVGRADLIAVAEAAVFSASAGEVLGPFKLPQGWTLLRVEAIQAAILDDATRNKIRNRLFEEWLQHARAKAQLHTPLLTQSALLL